MKKECTTHDSLTSVPLPVIPYDHFDVEVYWEWMPWVDVLIINHYTWWDDYSWARVRRLN